MWPAFAGRIAEPVFWQCVKLLAAEAVCGRSGRRRALGHELHLDGLQAVRVPGRAGPGPRERPRNARIVHYGSAPTPGKHNEGITLGLTYLMCAAGTCDL